MKIGANNGKVGRVIVDVYFVSAINTCGAALEPYGDVNICQLRDGVNPFSIIGMFVPTVHLEVVSIRRFRSIRG